MRLYTAYETDGDYIVYGHFTDDETFIEYARWLIPGTELEDWND